MFDLRKILAFLKKNFQGKDILILVLLVTVYFVTRLINLDKFPIFTDEGIYIHWAKVAWHDASWRFISLTDGKQPLQTWGMIPFLKLFPQNPLMAGRLFSVTTGFTALVGTYVTLFYLWGKKAANWGSFFYLLTPFFLFYDRMALIDSGVNAAFIWIFFFSIFLIRSYRLDIALIFGLVSGFSLLAKSSTKIFVALSALSPVLVWEKSIKRWLPKILNFSFLYLITLFLAFLIYNVQRLSPFLHFVAVKNKTFVMTLPEFLQNPFELVGSNLQLIPVYTVWESAFILPLIALFGFFLLFKKDKKLFLYILAWIILPYLAITFFAKVIFPRYLIFFGSIFLILASYYLSMTKNKILTNLLVGLYLLSVVYFNYPILFNQKNIPFPEVDRGQYIEGVSSGWGIREIVNFAREKSKEKPVIIVAEGNFGMAGDVLDASLGQHDRISIKAYWPLNREQLIENQKERDKNLVLVVFSHRDSFPTDLPLKFIKKFSKPGNKSAFHLFELWHEYYPSTIK